MIAWHVVLRRYRHTNGLTQSGLAELLGVDQPTVSRLERGTQSPGLGLQRAIQRLMEPSSEKDAAFLTMVKHSFGYMHLLDQNMRWLAVSPKFEPIALHLHPDGYVGQQHNSHEDPEESANMDAAKEFGGLFSMAIDHVHVVWKHEKSQTLWRGVSQVIRLTTGPALLTSMEPISEEEYLSEKGVRIITRF